MIKYFLFLTTLLIVFSLFPYNYVSCDGVSKKNISPSYFEKGLYDAGRLLSLNIPEQIMEDVEDFERNFFAKGNETLFLPVYHSFYRDEKDFKTNYSISAKDFEDELLVLKELSFEPVSLEDVYYYIKYGKAIPERSVLLTFDDGFKTFLYVYPIIKKYNFKGVLSIMTGFTGSSWSLNKDDINKLKKEGYVDFASHTHTIHNDFKKILTKADYTKIEEDIKKSRTFFESLGIETNTFTFPWGYGSNDNELIKTLKKYGFEIGLTTWKNKYNEMKSNPYLISRIEISKRTGLSSKEKFKEFLLEYLKH